MIQGFNSDIKYRGIIYHIQTQDKGTNNPKIETLIYKKGVVLATRRITYEDILASDCLEEVVTQVMKQQHQEAITEVQEGKFFDNDDTDVSILKRRVRESFEQAILRFKKKP